jgi:hypothetical protein
MLFRQLLDSETGTYTYLIADSATKEAVLVGSGHRTSRSRC